MAVDGEDFALLWTKLLFDPFDMPRKLRMEYPGEIYHVVNRGDRREDTFKDDLDRAGFLSTLEEAREKTTCTEPRKNGRA